MKYQVLGPVTVLLDEREIPLQQKCQHLLAVLVLERGQPVSRQRLIEILWDDLAPVGRGDRLTRIASELRQNLRTAMPGVPDPVPDTGDGYKLVMHPEEADVHRFRAKATKAKALDGDAAIQMTSDALDEWAEGHGLYGRPLVGLPGSWAESNREKLRTEHCDAHLFRLACIGGNGGHERVAEECHMLDDGTDALINETFVTMWMKAAYRTGGPNVPLSVYRRAEERYEHSLERPVGPRLAELARRIEDHDPALDDPHDIALARPHTSPPANTYLLTSVTGQTVAGQAKETTTMSEQSDRPLFHNENSTIGAQAKEFNGDVTINLGDAPKKPEPQQTGQLPDSTDDGQAS